MSTATSIEWIHGDDGTDSATASTLRSIQPQVANRSRGEVHPLPVEVAVPGGQLGDARQRVQVEPQPIGRPAARRQGPAEHDLLGQLRLRGPHDLRHTFATWLEDAGIPGRVIDELMGHAGGHRGAGAPSHDGSLIGTRYRWTTPDMEVRVVAAIEQRLAISFAIAARGVSLGRPERAEAAEAAANSSHS